MGKSILLRKLYQELFKPYEYCVSLDSLSTHFENPNIAYLKTRGNRVYGLYRSEKSQLLNSILYSKLKFSFFFPNLFVKTTTIQSKNKALLDFAVKRHIKQLALFEKGFRFCYDLISYQNDNALVNLYVLPPDKAEEVITQIPYDNFPVKSLIPLEKVFVEILSAVSEQLIVSIWVKNQNILCLATQGKKIVSRLSFTIDSDNQSVADQILNDPYVDTFIESVKKIRPDIKISLLFWGEHYLSLSEAIENHESLQIDRKLEKRISGLLKWKTYHNGYLKRKKVNPNALIRRSEVADTSETQSKKNEKPPKNLLTENLCRETLFSQPEIVGLSLSPVSQTFINPQYQSRYTGYIRSRQAFMVSIFIAFLFAVAGSIKTVETNTTQQSIQQQSSRIEQGINRVRSEIPDKKTINQLVEKAKKRKTLNSELKVNNFIAWITNITPNSAIINNLIIENVPQQANTNRQQKKQKKDPAKRYQIQMSVSLKQTYAESIKKIDTFLLHLDKRILHPDAKFVHISEDHTLPTELSLTFQINAEQFL